MAAVVEFIDRMGRMGWQYGERDCLLWLGLWTLEAVGIDGGAKWRGTYSTAKGCVRALRRSGGMMSCIRTGATSAGLILTLDPKPGAVGLIQVVTAEGVEQVGAIFNGTRWCALTPWGVLSVRTEPVVAWNLP